MVSRGGSRRARRLHERSSRSASLDPHGHPQPLRPGACARHPCDLDLEIDHAKKEIRGAVVLSLDRRDHESPLILDAKGLAIESVTGSDGSVRLWQLGPEDKNIGSALTIELVWADTSVRLAYHTTSRSDALQVAGS